MLVSVGFLQTRATSWNQWPCLEGLFPGVGGGKNSSHRIQPAIGQVSGQHDGVVSFSVTRCDAGSLFRWFKPRACVSLFPLFLPWEMKIMPKGASVSWGWDSGRSIWWQVLSRRGK